MSKQKPDELDCWGADNPVCPHCGSAYDLGKSDRYMDVSYEDGGKTEIDCPDCGKAFVAVTLVSYSYLTAIDDEHADDNMWGHREPEIETLETETT